MATEPSESYGAEHLQSDFSDELKLDGDSRRDVDGRKFDQLARNMSEFARRNPGLCLAAGVAAGFAAARLLQVGTDKGLRDGGGQESGQSTQDCPVDQQAWSADENIKPTPTGGFAPAYGDADSLPSEGL